MQLNDLGKWKVFALESGTFKLDGGAMMGSVPKVLWEKTNKPDDLNRIKLSMRCLLVDCLLYTSPSPRDLSTSRMPSSA